MSFENQNYLVLGGSGALGSRITSQLLARGANVLATASSQDGLVLIPQGAQKAVVDFQSNILIEELVSKVQDSFAHLDGVVVASGIVGFASAENTSFEMVKTLMTVNHIGPSSIINGLLPQLQNHVNEKATVLGITGVVVDQTFPGMSAYTASKTALASYLQSIGKEWRRYKIRTIDIRLGHTETGLAGRAVFGQAPVMPEGHDPDAVCQSIVDAMTSTEDIVRI